MAQDRRRGGQRRPRPFRRRRKKPCAMCANPAVNIVDYKNLELLRQYVDEHGRVRKARQTGSCRKHQSQVAKAIKLARVMALLPYVVD
ncbi:MAG: 30S ribosomal protein S18 [Armatimonadetes bacterium]|nr:30S ribosomal protein S18 [Armatimonadota bacterium]MDI9586105.1 30S ribosomal protein S18 [Acidobacteriota bacterium]NSW55342.1 30S ribosomal protein S18 [Armatimonadota bacterium]